MVGRKRKAIELDKESSDVSSNEEHGSHQQETSNDSGSRHSSTPPEELSPTLIRDQLRYCLADVKYVGSFTAFQARQRTVDPGLQVNGVGKIRLPLDLADAKAIMNASTQAPFGKGSKTIVDTEFRNTRELNPSQFNLRNPAWEQELQDIIAHLGHVLGFQDGTSNIKPELYKLLLYEKGGMFKPHRDSEKAEGMFGTLVICLPSEHSGGSVVLSHHGETVIVETAAASEFGQSNIAWYSDVTHEIKPVQSGYRLVLAYNLIRIDHIGPSSASALVDEKAKFERILKDWNRRLNEGQPTSNKLAWILDHKYSEANLSLRRLKGHDDLLGRYAEEICEKQKIVIMLANMTRTVFDVARGDNDEELEQSLKLSNVVEADGRLIIHSANIEEEEIIQADCFDRNPDKVEEEETGNEGVDETHFYHNAVMLLMPEAFALEFELAHSSSDFVTRWIAKLIGDLQDDPEQEYRNKLIQICRREAKALFLRRNAPLMDSVIKACIALKDVQLLFLAVRGCSRSHHRPGTSVHHAAAQALHVFPFQDVEPSLDELTHYDTKLHNNLMAINDFRSSYEDSKAANKDLSEIPEFKLWENARIEEILQRADQIVPEDATQIIDLLKRYGKDMANKHVLPLLKKHKCHTAGVISCLADIVEAGRKTDIPYDIAESIFDKALHTTTSSLSFRDLYPKQVRNEPSFHRDFEGYAAYEWRDETKLVERIVSFYCQCLLTHHESEAADLLCWLREEAETADIRVFHEIIFRFLQNLPGRLQMYGLSVSEMQRQVCQHMVLAFLIRCVGTEPAKSTTWTRPALGCQDETCLLCPKLDDFLHDPEREFGYLEDKRLSWYGEGHLYDRASRWDGHECTRNHEMEDGRKMLRIKKLDKAWAHAHDAWKRKCDILTGKIKYGFFPSRALLGERYDELVEMRPIKLCS